MRPLNVALVHGIHARPAAAVSACARRYAAEVVLEADGKRADARSVVALMTLGARKGERVTLRARGVDAAQAAEAIAALLEGGFEEAPEPPPPAPKRPAVENGGDPAPAARGDRRARPGGRSGVPLQGGRDRRAGDRRRSRHRARHPRARPWRGRARLERAGHGADRNRRDILEAHAAMLDDPELLARAGREIDEGASAGLAWRRAVRANASVLEALDDPRLKARAADLLDVERQVLSILYGGEAAAGPRLPAEAIVLADELLPSELASLDPSGSPGSARRAGGRPRTWRSSPPRWASRPWWPQARACSRSPTAGR